MTNPSKLINKAVEELKNRFVAPPDSDIGWIVRSDINPIFWETVTNKTLKKKLKSFLTKCIQESYKEGKKEAYMAGFGDGYDKGREGVLNSDILKEEVNPYNGDYIAGKNWVRENLKESLTKQSKENK